MNYLKSYNKCHNKKCEYEGIKFASKLEMKRYIFLKDLEKKGEIKNLRLQVPFTLQDKYKIEKKTIREIKYIADFVYEKDKTLVVEDTKGQQTPVFKLKKKIFDKVYYPLRITIVIWKDKQWLISQ